MSGSDKGLQRQQELAESWSALEREEFQLCIASAAPYLAHPTPELRREANKLTGLGHFRQARYLESVPFFLVAVDGSADANDWFNLVTSATLAGDIPRGEQAFQRAWECQERAGWSQQPSAPFMRYYYAQALRDAGEFRRALAQIEELRKLYEQLYITDDTFVYIRGVPFLPHTLRAALPVFKALSSEFNWEAWLADFAEKVDDDGKETIRRVLRELEASP